MLIHGRWLLIDHYLPKSVYPQLAIHPFNLGPICHPCNAWTKGSRDPLERPTGGRRELEDIWLPYREDGLSLRTFLNISFTSNPISVEFRKIRPRRGHILRQRIEILGEIYDLLGRWAKRRDEIGEKLFRRIHQYMQPLRVEEEHSPHGAFSDLDELIGIMHDEDLAREPFVFSMIWWLVKIVNEELNSRRALLAEAIGIWVQRRLEPVNQWQIRGREIRQFALEESMS